MFLFLGKKKCLFVPRNMEKSSILVTKSPYFLDFFLTFKDLDFTYNNPKYYKTSLYWKELLLVKLKKRVSCTLTIFWRHHHNFFNNKLPIHISSALNIVPHSTSTNISHMKNTHVQYVGFYLCHQKYWVMQLI